MPAKTMVTVTTNRLEAPMTKARIAADNKPERSGNPDAAVRQGTVPSGKASKVSHQMRDYHPQTFGVH